MKIKVSKIRNVWLRRAVIAISLLLLLPIAMVLGALSFSLSLLQSAANVWSVRRG